MQYITDDEFTQVLAAFQTPLAVRDEAYSAQDLEASWHNATGTCPYLKQIVLPRKFAVYPKGTELRRSDRLPAQDTPSLEDMSAILNDPERIPRCEAMALKLINRLKLWGAVDPESITWYFVDSPFRYVNYLGKPFDFAVDLVRESLENAGLTPVPVADSILDAPGIVSKVIQSHANWQLASQLGIPASAPAYAVPKHGGFRFEPTNDPFRGLIDVWLNRCFLFDVPVPNDYELRLYMRRV